MSGYGSIKQRTSEAAKPPEDPTKCYAQHCPCKASMSLEGGRFVCTAHAFAPSDQWPAITEKLNEFRWLIAFIDDIRLMDQTRLKNMPTWREFATHFWTGQDSYCIPHAEEEALPYQNRMRGELLYRCGQMKRPAPRLPQPVKVRGNAARYLGRGAS